MTNPLVVAGGFGRETHDVVLAIHAVMSSLPFQVIGVGAAACVVHDVPAATTVVAVPAPPLVG